MVQTLFPIADYSAGGTLSGTSGSRYTYVRDNNSSTYLQSTYGTSPNYWFVADAWYYAKLSSANFVPLSKRVTNSCYIYIMWSSGDTEWYDDATLFFRLYQGATLIASIQQTLGYDLLGSVNANPKWFKYYLTTNQMNSITDFKDLRAGFYLNVWNYSRFRCHEIRFICPDGITEGRPFIPTPF